eukprot:7065021-Alexandrium_andersonii.AAC.1
MPQVGGLSALAERLGFSGAVAARPIPGRAPRVRPELELVEVVGSVPALGSGWADPSRWALV